MLIQTAVFKIHNPSKHKIAVMNLALRQYTLAYDYLLKLAEKHIDLIKTESLYRGKVTTRSIEKTLSKIAGSKLKHFTMHGSMRESLVQDVASSLLSHIELKTLDDKTSFPTARQIKHQDIIYTEALKKLKDSTDLEEENCARDEISRSTRLLYMPIFFARPDGVIRNRNFGLLYDAVRNKYYATLYLLSNDSSKKDTINPGMPLRPINPISNEWHPTKREVCNIIVPLAFGDWHEQKFLKYALENPKSIRSAYLNYRNGDYFLHVSFEFQSERIDQNTILGIDRGIVNLAALTVTDNVGKIIYQKEHSGKGMEKLRNNFSEERKEGQQKGQRYFGKKEKRITDEMLHVLANEIVSTAVKYQSKVIMEDLKRLNYGGFKTVFKSQKKQRAMNHRLSRTPYNKLLKILEYKLPLAGLSKPALVDPRYTSQECPECEHIEKGNRLGLVFKCRNCGYKANADLNGAHNIARKWIWLLTRVKEKRKAG